MNAGAATAQGDILLFLHADTRLPVSADTMIIKGLQQHDWGFFKINLDGGHRAYRVIETFMNWRSRLSHIATGDQALFIRQPLFNTINGFPVIDIMEDIAISKRLRAAGREPFFITSAATTSCRRWEKNGIIRTVLLMWHMRLAYYLGADPAQLARQYR